MINIGKIEDVEFYIEKALRRSKKKVKDKKFNIKNKREKSIKIEIYKITIFTQNINKDLNKIHKTFQEIFEFDEFYNELIKAIINIAHVKKALVNLKWSEIKIKELENIYCKKLRKELNINKINKYKKEFYGRTYSILKNLNKHLKNLDEVRKKLRKLPTIKTNIPTICITGYPNVGKSTLLSKLTTSKPEIKPYAFTTKNLMVGYIGKKIQIIDTPGVFKNNFKEMNWIEKQSYLAIKYLSKMIIYVFDITERCGFLIKDQIKLYYSLKNQFKKQKFIIYISKSDIVSKKEIQLFKIKYNIHNEFINPKNLKKYISKII